jgi:ribosomal protein S18 acetylase RimI-like enzyme
MELKITEGITPSQIQDLIGYSNNDELILQTTKDKSRFANEKTVKAWLAKERKIYCLVNKTNKLLGIIWFGEEKMPTGAMGITFAIRIYADARGKGNAKPFMKEAFARFKNSPEYEKSESKIFWLETNSDNNAAIASYKSFGFKEVKFKNKFGRILMTLEI